MRKYNLSEALKGFRSKSIGSFFKFFETQALPKNPEAVPIDETARYSIQFNKKYRSI